MKRLVLFLLLLLATSAPVARAQSVEDQYLRIYTLIQAGDTLESAGQGPVARLRYQEAQTALQGFQKVNPEWNPKVVKYRLTYLATKLGGAVPETAPVVAKPEPVAPTINPEALTALQQQVASLQETLRHMEGDKSLLEAKLKEALAAQPAATDPQELVRAQGQIKELLKENELLKSTATETAATVSTNDKKALEEARQALVAANQKLATETEVNKALTVEREALQQRLAALTTSPAALEAMREENALLKKQLADARANPPKDNEAARKLEEAQTRIAALQSDTEVMRLEKIALENRVKTLMAQSAAAPAVVAAPADLERIKKLEADREDLARKLTAANQELSTRRGKAATARIEQLNSQIDALRARVEIFEARAVPYSPEELALFQKPSSALAGATKTERKPISELPSGVTALVVSAQKHFAAQEFDQAEKDYLEILRRDESNAYTLANLAAIQMQKGSLDDAEKSINKALAGTPDDDYSLLILGQIKFRQDKYDDSLEAFTRAAKLKPENAEIQNFIGVVLGQKGLRDAAEKALRRAIVLNPNYADAHYNLAVFYGTKDTSFANLAKWHYQRAKASGHPGNADVEKLIEKKLEAVPAK